MQDAAHAETAPDASNQVIGKLSCSLVGQTQVIKITPGTFARQIYGTDETVEEFRCNYGLHPAYRDQIERGGLKIAGIDAQGEVRMVELSGQRFFIATLFLPQLSSRADCPHRLVVAYLNAAAAFQGKHEHRKNVARTSSSALSGRGRPGYEPASSTLTEHYDHAANTCY